MPSAPLPVQGSRGGTLKAAVPQPAPHQDIHRSVSPILAGWGPGLAYSRLFRYRWIQPDEPHYGISDLAVRYDPQSSTSAHEIICDLCESWEMDSDGALTVKLRSGVSWHASELMNDRTLDSSDVVFSIDRLRDPKIPNSHLANTIADATALSSDTVRIDLTIPDAEIFDKLADARFAIVRHDAVSVDGDLLQGPTIGTGPWMLQSFERGRSRLIANPDYFIPELPLLDGLDIAVIEDPQVRVTALRTRKLDMIQPSVDDMTEALGRFDTLRWSRSHDASAGIEVAFNTTRGVLASHELRTAIIKSWDPNALIDSLHQGQAFLSAGLPINDPSWLLPSSEIDAYFNDRAGLLELLDEFSPPRGTILTIRTGEFGDEYIETARSLGVAIRSLGLLATIERVSTRVFGEDVWSFGDYEIYVGAPPPQSSTTSMLFAVHHSQAPWNTTGYTSEVLNTLIERQAVELDPVIRRELMLEVQREIMRGAHIFRPAAKVSHWLWWSHLQNIAPSTFRADSFWLTRLWMGDRP